MTLPASRTTLPTESASATTVGAGNATRLRSSNGCGLSRINCVAAGAGVTVITAEAEIPSLVAVMVVVPAATPDTRPSCAIVATDGALLVQDIIRPVNTLPFASFASAKNCEVALAANGQSPPSVIEATAA